MRRIYDRINLNLLDIGPIEGQTRRASWRLIHKACHTGAFRFLSLVDSAT
jgi:hypothetical protein